MLNLRELARALREHAGVQSKRAIQAIAQTFQDPSVSEWSRGRQPIRNGDDAAAIADTGGYLLLAAEGILPSFIAADPWFAGFCSIMVNVNDIAAMGGVPYAVVDVLFAGTNVDNRRVLEGLRDASAAYGVPVVGGHTGAGDERTWLSVAILGRAHQLLASHNARAGLDLLCAIDLRGAYRGTFDHFDAATGSNYRELRQAVALLSDIASEGQAIAAKDISQAGLVGTLLMLCECANVSARLELDRVPRPAGVDSQRWLTTFPSYGFLLACEPHFTIRVLSRFRNIGVAADRVGTLGTGSRVELSSGGQTECFWDYRAVPLTGFCASSGENPASDSEPMPQIVKPNDERAEPNSFAGRANDAQ